MRSDVLALVQAGGAGGRMDVLTRERAKPVLPYAGVHRLIDFTLTSLVHAGLRYVWVSVEYQVASLDEYLASGRPWDLDSSRGGFRRMVPQTGSGPPTEDRFAHGNGDLLLRLTRDLEAFGATTLLVSSADHVFNDDLRPVIASHLAGFTGAVAALGTAFTRDHVRTVERYATEGLVLLFDGDRAGFQAAERAMRELVNSRLSVRIALMADAKDPGDFLVAREGEDPDLVTERRARFADLLDGAEAALPMWFRLLRRRLDLSQAVRNAVAMLGASPAEALRMASLTPAEFMGVSSTRGRIAAGARADFVLLNDALIVERVWTGGRES